ncbi:MAG TPA: ABC transporter permease [Anaerolineae bacterium]
MKIWTVAWKDTLIRFRDRNALLLMLAAPLVIAAIAGAAFGGFLTDSGSTPVRDIPVLIVNDDDSEASRDFVEILMSADLADLLEPTLMDDLETAREVVRKGEVRAVVYISPGFGETLDSRLSSGNNDPSSSTIQLYSDPAASITPIIIHSVVTQIANGFITAGISEQIVSEHLAADAAELGPAMGTVTPAVDSLGDTIARKVEASFTGGNAARVTLDTIAVGQQEEGVNPLAFFVPSMGIFFLMFTMLDGTRSILDEQEAGTLDRLISTPASHSEILLGKIAGVFLTGILQFSIFVLISRLIFDVTWGDFLGLVVMVLAVVAAFTSLGALIAAFARDATQANIFGSAVALTFAALGGNFAPAQNFPEWLQQLSLLTINRWALDGFVDLTIRRLGLDAILPEAGVLLTVTLIFFVLGLRQFRRRIAR